MKRAKKIFFSLLTGVLILVSIEAISSLFLFVRYRSSNDIPPLAGDRFTPATIVIVKGFMARWIPAFRADFRKNTAVNIFYSSFRDDLPGSAANGMERKVVRYSKKTVGKIGDFEVIESTDDSGARYTGQKPLDPVRNVYILGDSCAYGLGVNDEQTFAYLLQSELRDQAFYLYAEPGGSMTQVLLKLKDLKSRISSKDVLVLGYASWYKKRDVAAPSRLKEIYLWHKEKYPLKEFPLEMKQPRFQLDPFGNLVFDYVNANCEVNKVYCESKDPSEASQADVTLAIMKEIARMTPAKIYVLFYDGDKNDPVLLKLPREFELIRATPDNYDVFIHDDGEGFDPHPGPYWHYAMFRRLRKYLSLHNPS